MLLPLILFVPLQDSPAPKTVVVAPRSEASATSTSINRVVITGEELTRTGERSLPRAIARAGGVWLQETNLGGGAPFVRGLTGNQILIVVDGVRLNDSTTRFGPNQSLNTIDPIIIDRVEVLRGPASVLYGSDAIGGAILIWTKSRRPGMHGGELGAAGEIDLLGQTATRGGRGSLALSHATEREGTYVSGSAYDWGDVRSSGDDRVPNTGYHGNDFFASEEFAVDGARSLRATARIHRDFDVPRTDRLNTGYGQTQPSDERWDYQLQERETFQLTYTDREANGFWDGMQIRAAASSYTEERDRIGNGSSSRRLEKDDVDTLSLGIDWQRAVGDANLLTFGFDFYHDDVDSHRTNQDLTDGSTSPGEGQFAPNSKYATAAVFVQDEIFAFEAIDVTAGVRYSYTSFEFDDFPSQDTGHEDGNFDAFTASLEVAGNITEDVRLTGNLASGFRAPNLDDLAKDGTFGGGVELHNADLDPEESVTFELTGEVIKESWRVALSGYVTYIDNLIGRRLVDSGGPQSGDETYERDNIADADILGTELFYAQRLGDEHSPYGLDVSLAYVWGRLDDDTVDPNTGEKPFDDEPIRRNPPFFGTVGLNYEPKQRVLGKISWARLETVFATKQTRLNPEDESDPRIDPDGTAGWVVVNIECGGPIGKTEGGSTWNVGILNLLDQDYRVHGSSFDAPGIGLVAGLQLRF